MNGPIGWLDLPEQESPEVLDPSRLWVEIVTTSGRAAAVEFKFRMETVEVWCANHSRGILDRAELRWWLADPVSELVVDEVTFTPIRRRDHFDAIAITLPEVQAWALSPVELVNLRERV
jgi:hypothetical protein